MATNNYQTVSGTIGPVRLSYAFLFRPTQPDKDKPAVYKSDLLIPKTDTALVKKVRELIGEAVPDDAPKQGGKLSPNFNIPLKDGDDKENGGDVYKGHYYLSAKSQKQPLVVKRQGKSYINADEDDVYSGAWVYVSIAFRAYNQSGNKGISCYLNQVLKYKDDEALSGVIKDPNTAFADVEIPDEVPNFSQPNSSPLANGDDDLPW